MSDGMDIRQWKDMMGEAAQPLDALPNDELVAKVREALDFQRSVILAGEAWTETCAVVESEAYAALSVLAGRLQDAQALAEALEHALDCRGPYNGVVSKQGGDPAICTECEEEAREALTRFAAVPPNQAEGHRLSPTMVERVNRAASAFDRAQADSEGGDRAGE